MPVNGEWDLRDHYQKFNTDDIDGFMALFASHAVYRQRDTHRTAVGTDQIRGFLASWDVYFEGAHIVDIQIKLEPHRVRLQPGATECYRVNSIGVGRYVRTLPGLKGIADAHGNEVRVPTAEIVWFGAAGKIIRVDQTMNIAALQ